MCRVEDAAGRLAHESLNASIRLRWKPWTISRHRVTRLGSSSGQSPAGEDVGLLRDRLMQAPAPPVARVERPALRGLNGELLQFWQAHRQIRTHSTGTFRDIFARMRLFMQLRRQHRELKARARFQKRRQLLDILERMLGVSVGC